MNGERTITHASFTLERRYKASPARVFRALTDPASKAKWFNPPEGWEQDEHSLDFRVGGTEVSIGGPPGGAVHKFRAVYQDIVPEERIVYSYDMELDDVRISVSLASFELKGDGDHTVLKLTEMGAYLDGFSDGNAVRREGTAWLLDKLGHYLARESAN